MRYNDFEKAINIGQDTQSVGHAAGGAFGSGTAPQGGLSWIRFPM